MALAKINTIIVLISVPKSDGLPFNPSFINNATKLANTADNIAYTNQALDNVPLLFFLSIINMVPTNINNIDNPNIHIINILPPLVVSSKKNIKNNILVNTKLDLSIGATLFTFPNLIAL